jgi:hypothetical protein
MSWGFLSNANHCIPWEIGSTLQSIGNTLQFSGYIRQSIGNTLQFSGYILLLAIANTLLLLALPCYC